MTVRGYSNVAYPIYLVGALNGTDITNTISVSATSGGAPADPSGWPSTRPYFIAIDPDTPNEEICLVTNVTGSSLDITRAGNLGAAAFGSTTKAHQSGAQISHVVTASDLSEANAHVNATQAVHGLAGGSNVVGTNDNQTLSNKTLSATTGVSGGGVVASTTGAQVLTNKTLGAGTLITNGSINSAVTLTAGGDIVGTTATQIITGKTFTAPNLNAPVVTGAKFKGGILFDITHPDFGAVGDGSTNDAAAVQAAMDAAAPYGGITYAPGGKTYALATTVRPPSYTQLYVAPGAAIKRTGPVSMFIFAAAGQNIGGYGGVHDCWVGGGGTIDGNGAGETTANNVFTLAHSRNITIENITIANTSGYHSIEVNGSMSVRIDNVKFWGYYQNGAGTFREAIQVDLAKDAASTTVTPYDQTTVKDLLVTRCSFTAHPTSGAGAHSVAFGGHSATVGVHMEDIRFINNHCDGLGNFAVNGYAWTRLAINDNHIINCAGGIRVDTIDTGDPDDTLNVAGTQTSASQPERQFSVRGNQIYNCTSLDAIRIFGEATGKTLGGVVGYNTIDTTGTGARGVNVFSSDRIACNDNTIYATNGSAIYFDTSRDSTASDNIIVGPGGTGIFGTGVIGFIAQGNRINNPGGDAVQITGTSSYFTIAVNQILDAGTHGINVFSSCADFLVFGNEIRGASKNAAGISSALRCSANCARGTWAMNRTRRSGAVDYLNALSFTNTCTEMKRFGNVLQDGMNTSGVSVAGSAINDLSVTPSTDALDITAV